MRVDEDFVQQQKPIAYLIERFQPPRFTGSFMVVGTAASDPQRVDHATEVA